MDKIVLPRMSIEITTNCNLRCESCSVGIPTMKERIHLTVDEVRMWLKEIFQVVDYVNSLEFTGGEPFLHKQLPEMIHAYMEYKEHFNQFLIVTNGTVTPDDELFDVLEQYKDYGVIHISDYGISQEVTGKLAEKLKNIGITYRVDKYWGDDQYQGGWVEPGPVVSHKRSKDQLCSVFSNCGLAKNGGCWRIHKGTMHFCARSARCFEAGFQFPEETLDFLDNSISVDEKKHRLASIISIPYLNACDYCNGDMGTKDESKRIPAGKQVKKQA